MLLPGEGGARGAVVVGAAAGTYALTRPDKQPPPPDGGGLGAIFHVP